MRHKYLANVTTLSFDAKKCVGCELCIMVCPHGVFVLNEGWAQIADKDFCIECGACALNCITRAIKVNSGVGCAAAFINGWITGGEPNCGSGGCC